MHKFWDNLLSFIKTLRKRFGNVGRTAKICGSMTNEKVLVIGSCGQLGTELVEALRGIYGDSNVIASDVKKSDNPVFDGGPFETLDILDADGLGAVIQKYKPTQVYHLAALLSATAEKNPEFGWKLNMEGLFHVLNAARDTGIIKKV